MSGQLQRTSGLGSRPEFWLDRSAAYNVQSGSPKPLGERAGTAAEEVGVELCETKMELV